MTFEDTSLEGIDRRQVEQQNISAGCTWPVRRIPGTWSGDWVWSPVLTAPPRWAEVRFQADQHIRAHVSPHPLPQAAVTVVTRGLSGRPAVQAQVASPLGLLPLGLQAPLTCPWLPSCPGRLRLSLTGVRSPGSLVVTLQPPPPSVPRLIQRPPLPKPLVSHGSAQLPEKPRLLPRIQISALGCLWASGKSAAIFPALRDCLQRLRGWGGADGSRVPGAPRHGVSVESWWELAVHVHGCQGS